jgi:eukaryotic-like serine/threonine-protein kinase
MARMPDTLSSDSTHLSEATKSQAITTPGGPNRSTVLPRVEWVGPNPKVNPEQRHRFEELGLLGEGGMGEVVLAKDHDIEREVALKRLPENCDLGRVLRFVEEIRTVGRLEHPNIIPVHDVGVDASGRYYFVMKRLHGETLESVIARLAANDPAAHARFTIPVRVQIFLQVLNALSYAHQQGFIHRDLKPANIMIGPYGEVTVMDWGLAKRIRAPEKQHGDDPSVSGPRDGTVLQTQLGSVMGTPMYMSPEQAIGAHDTLDERSDLYSLTVIFHELLHLRHYLSGRNELQQVLDGVKTEIPVLHDSFRAGERPVPADLDWFLERGFHKAAGERYQSVTEMQEELQRIIRGECRVQCPRTFSKRLMFEGIKLIDRRPVVVMAVNVTLGALVVLGLVKLVSAFV